MASDAAKQKSSRGIKPNAAKVRQLRLKKGLSLAKLAALSGCSPSTIQSLERGTKAQDLDVFARVAGALGVNPPDLYADDALGDVQGAVLEHDACKSAIAATVTPPSSQSNVSTFKVTFEWQIPFESFVPASMLPKFREELAEKINQVGELIVDAVRQGSVHLDCRFTQECDLRSLIRAFVSRSLLPLRITRIGIESSDVDVTGDVAEAFAPLARSGAYTDTEQIARCIRAGNPHLYRKPENTTQEASRKIYVGRYSDEELKSILDGSHIPEKEPSAMNLDSLAVAARMAHGKADAPQLQKYHYSDGAVLLIDYDPGTATIRALGIDYAVRPQKQDRRRY
jgi:transcriptional regulator with XRE-family HTH domain